MQVKNVIVPLDGSVVAERALSLVRNLVGRDRLRVWLVRVVDSPGAAAEAEQYLAAVVGKVGPQTEAVVRTGEVAGEILALAGELDHPLVVLGTHGHGAEARVLLGRTAATVVAAARVPVMLVETLAANSGGNRGGRVVLLVCGREVEPAVWYAAELGRYLGSGFRVEVVSGPDYPGLGPALLEADLAVVATDLAEGIPAELLRVLAAARVRDQAVPVLKLGPTALARSRASGANSVTVVGKGG